MTSSAQWPGVVCLGEALIDRLGPPGGDPAVDRPVDDRLGGAPANGPVAWPAWAPPWPSPDVLVTTPLALPFPDCLLSVVSRRRFCSGMPSVPVESCWCAVLGMVNGSFRVLTEIRGPALPTRRWRRLPYPRPDGC